MHRVSAQNTTTHTSCNHTCCTVFNPTVSCGSHTTIHPCPQLSHWAHTFHVFQRKSADKYNKISQTSEINKWNKIEYMHLWYEAQYTILCHTERLFRNIGSPVHKKSMMSHNTGFSLNFLRIRRSLDEISPKFIILFTAVKENC